jgi:hypothetical protein
MPRPRDRDATYSWHCLVIAEGHAGPGSTGDPAMFKKIALAALASFLLFGAVHAEAGIRVGDLPGGIAYADSAR